MRFPSFLIDEIAAVSVGPRFFPICSVLPSETLRPRGCGSVCFTSPPNHIPECAALSPATTSPRRVWSHLFEFVSLSSFWAGYFPITSLPASTRASYRGPNGSSSRADRLTAWGTGDELHSAFHVPWSSRNR